MNLDFDRINTNINNSGNFILLYLQVCEMFINLFVLPPIGVIHY